MTYRASQQSLNKNLQEEFKDDLEKWGAEITKDNVLKFNSLEVLFNLGSSKTTPKFQNILNDFFPRYLKVLTSEKYINEVDEIRVEGHTSDEWYILTDKEQIYLKNMELSRERANNVLSKIQIYKTT